MRMMVLLATTTLFLFSLAGRYNGSISSFSIHHTAVASAPVAPWSSQPGNITGLPTAETATPSATRFSSAYTDLTKCGSGMTKKEEKEAEAQGSDIPTRCKGYGGYDIYIYYSACTSEVTLEKGQDSIHVASQAVNFKQKIVEWRLANGKPFAVILRVYQYSGDDQCAAGGKVIGESLIVKGLKGYERIDQEVKVKGTPNPNVKAREIADKAYQ